MAGLFESLSSASRALVAARFGLDVTGQNIANINTPGYTRRSAVFADVAPTDMLSAGGGVSIVGAFAMRDRFTEARLRSEMMAGSFDAAASNGLAEIEAAIGLPGQSIDGELSELLAAFSALADDPASLSARDAVVAQGQELARAFQSMAERFTTAARNADATISSSVLEVNQLAAEVAHLNDQISAGGPDLETLRDRREIAVARLSEIAGVSAITRADGQVDLAIGAGRALVVGAIPYSVTTALVGPEGYTTLSIGGFDITGEVSSGLIGGLTQFRDTTVPGYQARLDQLAYDFASHVNALHTSGFDSTGAGAGDFFAPLASATGASRLLTVDAAIAANSQLVAASGTGAAGNNDTARAIAALREARIVNGGTATATEAWGQLAYRVGADVSAVRASSAVHDDVIRQLQALRAQTSGVSMDEEAANLIRFQRSYEANARYFTTIVDTLDTLMNMVR